MDLYTHRKSCLSRNTYIDLTIYAHTKVYLSVSHTHIHTQIYLCLILSAIENNSVQYSHQTLKISYWYLKTNQLLILKLRAVCLFREKTIYSRPSTDANFLHKKCTVTKSKGVGKQIPYNHVVAAPDFLNSVTSARSTPHSPPPATAAVYHITVSRYNFWLIDDSGSKIIFGIPNHI